MDRVILHWTGGTSRVSGLDRQHYHRIIDAEGSVFAGIWPIEANANIDPRGRAYAAHTRACNTGSIGVALAGMGGATERPFSAGQWPLNQLQMRAAAQVVADLCRQYRIPVTPRTVLTHAEVQPTLGIAQIGKWDITRLPWRPDLIGHRAVGDHIRDLVRAEMAPPAYKAPAAPTPVPKPEPTGFLAMLLAALRGLFGPKKGA